MNQLNNDQFRVGQRVKLFDADDNCYYYGDITNVESQQRITIEWDDMCTEVIHDVSEDSDFNKIKIVS